MSKSTYQRHLDAIASGTVERTNIIGIRKALNHAWRLERGYSGNRSSITVEQADNLLSAIYKHKPLVTGALHDSGVKVLQNPRYRKRWTERQAAAIADIAEFRLIDFEEIGHGNYVPVYRVTGRNGDSFDFRNVPWQSGGNGPEIV